MKEYDFRVSALADIRSGDGATLERARELRALLLDMAGGFTEIPPGVFQDIFPGEGLGYIVALESRGQARALQARLNGLALRWGAPAPPVVTASKGPRKDYCLFLLPESANPDHQGRRRPLFTQSKWRVIESKIRERLSHPVAFVYGEWRPLDSSYYHTTDVLRMYVARWESEATADLLREFFQTYVFDGGRECDQFCFYLSVRGESELVQERY
jgi:hypothetical protein